MTRETILEMSLLPSPAVEVEVEVKPTVFSPLSSNLLLLELSPSPAWLLLSNTPV